MHIYVVSENIPCTKTPINFPDVSIFLQKPVFFLKKSAFTQRISMRAVFEVFSPVFSFCKLKGYFY